MQDRRYIIQQHTTSDGVLWDLLLELDNVLATFRLEEMPETSRNARIRAEKIFDHPLRFLTYEGPVQQGTGRVRIADRGTYRTRKRSEEAIVLNFSGDALRGDFTLTRVHETLWEFTHTDRPARE
ncbi:MAG: hypothetical protein JSW27_24330 [Phycisphaerales bacterium]|nr:MAG: hypothetical protein JSW27_24330 [Phycisphaerales bacterium]